MNTFTLTFLLLVPFVGFAQYQSDTVFFEGTSKPHHIYLHEGKSLLRHKLFYETGELLLLGEHESEFTYKNTFYYKSGKPEAVWNYADDMAQGLQLGWYETGEVKDSSICTNDTCIKKTFYPSGKLKQLQYLLKGRVYMVEEWCENGQFIERTVDDSIYYPYKKYWCNGKVMYEGTLIYSNIVVGEWKQYYEDGGLELTGQHRYNPDSESRADENPQVGEWHFYDEKGKLISSQVFDDNGNLISEKIFD